MKKIIRILIATALAAPFVGSQVRASAIVGATEITQILNNIELVGSQIAQLDQLAQQIQSVQTQIQQYQTMVRNLQALPTVQWNHVGNLINQLHSLQTTASSFAYAAGNWDNLFNAQHPDFASYLSQPSLSRPTFTTLYTKWNTDNADAVKVAVSAAGLTNANLATDKTTLDTLETMSGNAVGQLSAIQASNKFAKMLNEQVLLLRQLISEEVKMQGTFQAAKNEQEAAQTAETLRATKATRNFVTGSEKRY